MLLDIIYVCCDCIMGIWLLFGRVAVSIDCEYIWRCVDESDLGTVVIRLLDDGDRLVGCRSRTLML